MFGKYSRTGKILDGIDLFIRLILMILNIIYIIILFWFLIVGRGRSNDVKIEVVEKNKKLLEEKKNDFPDYVYQKLLDHLNDEKYFNYVINLPFKKSKIENSNIEEIKKILDDNFFGLDELKKEVINFLVRKKNGLKNKNLLFFGCPGNGKTSFAQIFAKALNREFITISLGGASGESKIRGFAKTFVDSEPGQIIKGIRECGYNNPVVLLDEIDKIGNTSNGDGNIKGTLAELLDPKQNNKFKDNYLDFTFDLSNVLFIATANNEKKIDPFLKDRFDYFKVKNYSAEELNKIFDVVIGPKIIKNSNLKNKNISFEKDFFKDEINSCLKKQQNNKCYKITLRQIENVAEDVLVSFLKKNIVNNNIIEKKNFSEEKKRILNKCI